MSKNLKKIEKITFRDTMCDYGWNETPDFYDNDSLMCSVVGFVQDEDEEAVYIVTGMALHSDMLFNNTAIPKGAIVKRETLIVKRGKK